MCIFFRWSHGFMFPELVLELKVTLFSLTLCVLLPEGETVSQRSTIKKKSKKGTIRRWNISKKKKMKGSRTQRVIRSCPPPPTIRTGHDGKKAANWHRISPEDFEHLSCPSFLFFWLKNECCPVVLKEAKVLCLNCPSTGLCWFYTFFFFCTLDSPW